MNYLSTVFAAMLSGLVLSPAFAGDYNFTPGLWETTTTMDVIGAPPEMAKMMKMPPQVEQDCMTEKNLFDETDGECKYDKKRVSAKKLQINMTCNSPNGIEKGKGEVNFNGKKTSGWFEMNTQGPTGPMKMKSAFTARYIGACKE